MSGENVLILVVEDDLPLAQLLKNMIEAEGFEVVIAQEGAAALEIMPRLNPSLVLLDIGLPDIDGVNVCKSIRRFSQTPVIMLTGKSEVQQKVDGLYAGADDYITKPFAYSELLARIFVVLRRAGINQNQIQPAIFKNKDLTIDFGKQVVMTGENRIDLSTTEYRILAYLARHKGEIVQSADLIKDVWGENYARSGHLLQVNISRLRQKLNDNAQNGRYIETRPGQGYVLLAEHT